MKTKTTTTTTVAILSTLLLVSCGKKTYEDPKTVGYDKVGTPTNEAENLLEMVKQDLISYGVKEKSLDFSKIRVVGVGNIYDTLGGICMSDTKNIILNKRKFSDGTYAVFDKKEVIAHELGHCLFNLDHDDSRFNLMNTYRLPISNTMYYDVIKDFANKLISLGY